MWPLFPCYYLGILNCLASFVSKRLDKLWLLRGTVRAESWWPSNPSKNSWKKFSSTWVMMMPTLSQKMLQTSKTVPLGARQEWRVHVHSLCLHLYSSPVNRFIGREASEKGVYVYLQLIHIVVQHKWIQGCKAIILQLKKKKKKYDTLEPRSWNYWSLHALQSVLNNKKSHQIEKPTHYN